MSKCTVEFSFSIWQQVKLIHADVEGVITAMSKNADGLSYQVTYWYSAEKKSVWVRLDEIYEVK